MMRGSVRQQSGVPYQTQHYIYIYIKQKYVTTEGMLLVMKSILQSSEG